MASGTVLVTNMVDLDGHDTGAGHPERPERLPAVEHGLAHPALAERLVPLAGRQATIDEMARAHDRDHLEYIERFIDSGAGAIDADTFTCATSWETARWASGAGLAAIEALEDGDADAAFVSVRPPGHHATRDKAMGFCLVNNIAVAASTLADRGEKVLIVDWDVHHGNGTQDIFWDDDRVLFVSTHQSPFYPGSGAASEVGATGTAGTTINIPLPAGATGDAALAAFDEVIAPAAEAFAPTWVLISAGFDAHRLDPLAQLAWTSGDFAALATRVTALAPTTGRTIAFLEGGYDLEGLSMSVTGAIGALAGIDTAPETPSSGGPGREAVTTAKETRHRTLNP